VNTNVREKYEEIVMLAFKNSGLVDCSVCGGCTMECSLAKKAVEMLFAVRSSVIEECITEVLLSGNPCGYDPRLRIVDALKGLKKLS
jgi:predicted methyltransferase MtxX (methanogen marker protein 4)